MRQENGKGTKRKRGGKAPGSGDDIEGDDGEDWTRQRKDNHVSRTASARLSDPSRMPATERS